MTTPHAMPSRARQLRRVRRAFVPLVVALALGAHGTPGVAQSPLYRVEVIAANPTASPTDQNHGGTVIGDDLVAGNQRGFVITPGQALVHLPLPAGRISSWAREVNDLGVIIGAVGSSYSPEFFGVAAVWTPAPGGGYTVQELGLLPGTSSSDATALNNVGDILGWCFNGQFKTSARFVPGSPPVSLAATGIFDPQSVNDARIVLDRSGDAKLLDLNTLQVTSLGVPTGFPNNYNAVRCSEINAVGQVSGVAILANSTCIQHAARFTPGIGWEIFGNCSSYSGVIDQNDLGELTLSFGFASSLVQLNGFGTFAVGLILDAPVGQWSVTSGFRINNASELVGRATNIATGQPSVVRLTPIHPVGTASCFGDGSAGACPCGTPSAPGAGEGCAHSGGVGARLRGAGGPSVTGDSLRLEATQLPPQTFAVLFMGSTGVAATPLGAGLRCAGGSLFRYGARGTGLGGAVTEGPGLVSASQAFGPLGAIDAGETWVFQLWYRANAGVCATSNVSNAVAVTFEP